MNKINKNLGNEWTYLQSSEEHRSELDENSGMYQKLKDHRFSKFDLKFLSTDRHLCQQDTGILTVLHSWYVTNIEASSKLDFEFYVKIIADSIEKMSNLMMV